MIPPAPAVATVKFIYNSSTTMKNLLRSALAQSTFSGSWDQARRITANDKKDNRRNDDTHEEDESQAQELNQIINALSDHELEVAAKAAYQYLMEPNPSRRHYFARQYAKNFLRAQDGNTKKALASLKETLAFRTKVDVDRLRTSFCSKRGDRHWAQKLEQEVRSGNVYVQGHDREGRSTYVFVPRNVKGHDKEWTIKQHVYTLERAVASSRAPDKTVNAVVDFNGFSTKNAPPTSIGKEFMTTFRNHYAGNIHNIYLIDVPGSFLCVWALLKPILGKRTRNKIHFVKSQKNELSKYYDADQAASWWMKGGRKNRDLDVEEYLYKTPFHMAFDDDSLN